MHRVTTMFRRLFSILVLAGTVAGAIGSDTARGQTAPGAAVMVFEGARLVSGDARPAIENATVVVSGGRFTQVGRSGQVRVPAGATRINLAGKTIMPAIVDTHTHLSQRRDALTEDLQRRAYYGVGAALSLGQDVGELASQVRTEMLPGAARFFTAGRGITMPEPGRTTAPYWVVNDMEARTAVRELAANKVNIVKIWVDDRDDMYQKMTPAIYRAVIDEAHKNRLKVTAHIFELEDAKGLLRAGIDAFAHGVRDKDIDAEGLALFKAHPNVVVVPNLPDRGIVADFSWLSDSVPSPDLQKLQDASTDRPAVQAAFGIQGRNLARLSAAGVRIALGTDGNTPWAPHTEMEDMVAAGMTPAQVLVAATKTSAQLVGLADGGTIETGKSADFIVLNANPLEDIRNTRRIAAVYLRGTQIDRAAMRATR